MTATNVTLALPCPTCGADATWYGAVTVNAGTVYRIDCACTTVAEPEPAAAEPEPPAVIPERLAVLRQLQARYGWTI